MLPDYVILKDIDLKIRQGEFVTIIGDVGSGKSSLMNAMIGDMLYFDAVEAERLEENSHGESFKSKVWKAQGLIEKNKGKRKGVVSLSQSLGYVQQTPWIRNQTIRDNILFGLDYDEEKYAACI